MCINNCDKGLTQKNCRGGGGGQDQRCPTPHTEKETHHMEKMTPTWREKTAHKEKMPQ